MAEMNENKDYRGGSSKNKAQRNGTAGEGLSNYVFGKIQPQALPLEEAVLGALMLDREALPVVMDILRPESFYHEAHQHVYRAVVRLFERSNPVDILTVTEELRKTGELEKVGGSYYLVELTNRVASAANIEYHARIIAQKHIQRELIRVATNTIKDAYEDTTDVFTLLDEAEKGLFGITQNNLSRTFESMGTLSSRVLKQVEELAGKTDGLTGVPTGFTDLDRLTSGWQPSDLIILAARPGMGKTSCVLAMALNAARDFNKGVAVFSLEMASAQLVQRLISMEAEIPGSKMRNGKLEDYEWQQLQTTVERLSTIPVFIDDTPGINIFELRAKCRRLKMQHDIQLVIIDYLQLMTGASENNRNANREQEIAGISRALKNMAKELSVPVIALSQLSRAVEVRGGSKRPQLSDLTRIWALLSRMQTLFPLSIARSTTAFWKTNKGQSPQGGRRVYHCQTPAWRALDTIKLKFTDQFARFGNLDDPAFAGLNDPLTGPFTPSIDHDAVADERRGYTVLRVWGFEGFLKGKFQLAATIRSPGHSYPNRKSLFVNRETATYKTPAGSSPAGVLIKKQGRLFISQ
jgi:replicative DNA helicase